jgi:hypothetical protein
MCVKKEDDICTTVVYVSKSHENHLVQFSHAKIVGFPDMSLLSHLCGVSIEK